MSTDAIVDIGSLIVSDPEFRNGKPCIAGTGMSVHAIAARYRQGESAEAIAEDLFDIPLGHVYAAIAYYLANRARLTPRWTRKLPSMMSSWRRAWLSERRVSASPFASALPR